jgi:hypothetical protein
MAFEENYQQPETDAQFHQPWRILKWLVAKQV